MKRPHVYRRINGRSCERTPINNPYSYTAFCIYKNGWKDTDEFVFSDRLNSWYENYRGLKEKMLGRGDYFSSYEPEDIEKFLSFLFDKEITLTGIEEECNVSNGYPYWIFYYRDKEIK